MFKVFEDKTQNGKVRPWKERKIENVRYAEYLSILEFKRAHDVRGCGEILRSRQGLTLPFSVLSSKISDIKSSFRFTT